jgi:nucleoside-diphosphate-sugar epimerase
VGRKVLILGGARFHGLQLAMLLNAKGDGVYVLNRGKYKTNYPSGIKHLVADRNNYLELKKTIESCHYDIVVDNNAYDQQQVELLLNLIQKKCEHYVFTSTAAVYLTLALSEKLDEKQATGEQNGPYPPNIRDYAVNKFIAENFIQKITYDLNFTILRFPNIFGEGDFAGKLAYFYFRFKDGQRVLFEKQINSFSIVYIKDAVNVFDAVIGNDKCFHKVLNICDPQPYNYSEFFRIVYGQLYSPQKLARVDATRLWENGFYLPFAWGPMLDTTSAKKILGDISFTPLRRWCNPAIKWEIEHFRNLYQMADYARMRKSELELISRLE